MNMRRRNFCWLLAFGWLAACSRRESNQDRRVPLRLAVASNFAKTASELARAFEANHPGTRVELSHGSSGKLYAQIANGAPFDIFCSADQDRPERLQLEGWVGKAGVWRYARGRLALLGPALEKNRDGPSVLMAGEFRHLAIAEPASAPYGAAAKQVLESMGLWAKLEPRLVRGENVAQAYQFVVSGNAELGFVPQPGSREQYKYAHWVVPAELHDPIWQACALIERPGRHPRAPDFVEFMQSERGQQLIVAGGYDSGDR